MLGIRIPRESSAGWHIDAPAKLNVYLDVLPKRPDGFHGIRTLLCPVRLSDSLLIRPTGGSAGRVELTVRNALPPKYTALIPADENNLVVRAVRSAWARRETTASCAIVLDKRIPSEAGLGGGSSDAAAALVAANHIWRLALSDDELLDCAAELGSDVPGLLSGAANLCEGRGELLTPAAVPSGIPCVIAKPAVGLSTAAVFAASRPDATGGSTARVNDLVDALRSGRWSKVGALLLNRLEATARSLSQELCQLADSFAQFPFIAHQMSGSGSAYFGLCRNHRQAAHAASCLRARHAVWAVATCTA